MNFLLPRVGTAAAAAAAGETFAPIQLESKWLGSAFSLEFDGGPRRRHMEEYFNPSPGGYQEHSRVSAHANCQYSIKAERRRENENVEKERKKLRSQTP